ncbi:MAG: hypothetical protein NDI88_00615 [Lysobacter sp.]|nr:hypothetical protein [Lysobacter sp.]
MRKIDLVLAAAALATGCAALVPAPAPVPGEVRIVPAERRGWNTAVEANLYRVEFDAVRVREIARNAATLARDRFEGDLPTAEVTAMELDAERELRARGKCDGGARLVSPASLRDSPAGVSAIFKCVPPVF